MYYFSYDSYFDRFGSDEPDKLTIKPEVLTRVTDTIRELLLQGGDNGFEEEDLTGAVQDWERDEENPEMAIVSIELFDDGRNDGQPHWYSREFTFTECGIVSKLE